MNGFIDITTKPAGVLGRLQIPSLAPFLFSETLASPVFSIGFAVFIPCEFDQTPSQVSPGFSRIEHDLLGQTLGG